MPRIYRDVSEAGINMISISTWPKTECLQATASESGHVLTFRRVRMFGGSPAPRWPRLAECHVGVL